jgi:hypothetical protein
MRLDDNNCPNCERPFYGPHNFCPFCGCNVLHMDTVVAQIELEKEERQAAEEQQERELKRKSPEVHPPPVQSAKKKNPAAALLIAGALVGGFILAGFLGSSDTETSSPTPTSASPSASSSSPKPTVTAIPFSAVTDLRETKENAAQFCSQLSDAIEVPDFLPRPAAEIAAEVDNISSKSRASTYVQDNGSWIYNNMVDEFRLSLRDIVRPGVAQLVEQLGYDTAAFEVDSTQWLIGLTNQSMEACALEDELENTEELVEQFQIAVDAVIELAK